MATLHLRNGGRVESDKLEKIMTTLKVIADLAHEPDLGPGTVQPEMIKQLAMNAQNPDQLIPEDTINAIAAILQGRHTGGSMCRLLFGDDWRERLQKSGGQGISIVNEEVRAIISAADPQEVISYAKTTEEKYKIPQAILQQLANYLARPDYNEQGLQSSTIKELLWSAKIYNDKHPGNFLVSPESVLDIADLKGSGPYSGPEICEYLFGAGWSEDLNRHAAEHHPGLPIEKSVREFIKQANPAVEVVCREPLDPSHVQTKLHDDKVKAAESQQMHERMVIQPESGECGEVPEPVGTDWRRLCKDRQEVYSTSQRHGRA